MDENMGTPLVEEPKKNKTLIIVIAVLAVLCCCCVGGFIALYYGYDFWATHWGSMVLFHS